MPTWKLDHCKIYMGFFNNLTIVGNLGHVNSNRGLPDYTNDMFLTIRSN